MLFSGVAAAQNQQIVARNSGKCLTVEEVRGPAALARGGQPGIVQITCDTRVTQQWRVVQQMNGVVQIQSVSQNQCLTVPEGSTMNNAALVVAPCGQGINSQGQAWEMRNTGRGAEIISARSRKCVDVENGVTNDGARVVQFDCGRGEQELFEMRMPGGNGGVAQVQPMQPNVPQPMNNVASIAGSWRWSNNTTVDFWDNGTARSSNGQTAQWNREDARRFVITWSEGWVDRVMIAEDNMHLRGSNQNGGEVNAERNGAPAYNNQGYNNQPNYNQPNYNQPNYNQPNYNNQPTYQPPPPQPVANPLVNNLVNRENAQLQNDATNCGAGAGDPGCGMNRNGNRPPDSREFMATIENLRRRPDEGQRHVELNNLFNNRVITARQFGVLMDLFLTEPMKIDIAHERARSVLDPDHLNEFAGRFRTPTYRQDYENTIANAQRELRGGATPMFRGEVIRR